MPKGNYWWEIALWKGTTVVGDPKHYSKAILAKMAVVKHLVTRKYDRVQLFRMSTIGGKPYPSFDFNYQPEDLPRLMKLLPSMPWSDIID